MANTHSTLSALFTDIAGAIREVDGSTGKIVADTFPDKIRNLSSGHLYQEVANLHIIGSVEKKASTGKYLHLFPYFQSGYHGRMLTKNDAEIDLILFEFNVSDKCNVTLFVSIKTECVLTMSTVDGVTSYSCAELIHTSSGEDLKQFYPEQYYSFPSETLNGHMSSFVTISYNKYQDHNALIYSHTIMNSSVLNQDPQTGYIADTDCGKPTVRIIALSRVAV